MKDDLLADVIDSRDAEAPHDCEAMPVGQGATFKIADADNRPVDEARATAFRRQVNRAAGMSVADAVRARITAERKRAVADHLERQGDRVGPRLELAEAAELETVADLAIDPGVQSTAWVGGRRRR